MILHRISNSPVDQHSQATGHMVMGPQPPLGRPQVWPVASVIKVL